MPYLHINRQSNLKLGKEPGLIVCNCNPNTEKINPNIREADRQIPGACSLTYLVSTGPARDPVSKKGAMIESEEPQL